MESTLESDTIEFTKWFKKLSNKKKELASVLMIPNVDVPSLNRIRNLTDTFDSFDNIMSFINNDKSIKVAKLN